MVMEEMVMMMNRDVYGKMERGRNEGSEDNEDKAIEN